MRVLQFEHPEFGFIGVKVDISRNCLPNQFTPPDVIREIRYPAGTQPRRRCSEPHEPQLLAVPSVVGLSLVDAQNAVRAAGFSFTVTQEYSGSAEPDTVLSQAPGPGEEALMGTPIALTVATDVPSEGDMVAVPDVVKMQRLDAVHRLEDAGFAAEILDQPECEGPDCAAVPDQVWSQNPPPGAQAALGSTITIWVNPSG
jgi:beta-lactam-binding protein with PASTA domain